LEDVQVIQNIHESGTSPTNGYVVRTYHLQIV
jgi:hypothetical protein